MFKFNYEFLDACEPFVTCIVPEGWLTLNLPRFGENVDYVSDVSMLPKNADSIFTPDHAFQPRRIYSKFVFEFSEAAGAESLLRIISLEIKKKGGMIDRPTYERIVGPVRICCHRPKKHRSNTVCHTVLLNHLLGGIAGSIPVGLSWLDWDDFLGFLEAHRELQFEFAGGDDFREISSRLRQSPEAKGLVASFPMMYCSSKLCRLEYLDVVMDILEVDLIYAPSVKGQQKFVSWLFSTNRRAAC